MAELLTRATRFLRTAARQPFVFGHSDCALFVADYVMLVTGRDGAAHLRGTYDSLADAMHLCGRGGLAAMVGRCARTVGLKRTRSPQPGDIGVVVAPGGGACCAILTARGWVVRCDRGLMCLPSPRLIAAWTLGDFHHG